ncbi:MAG TPA: ABC transporter ATP-binding protein [Bacteroidales bacterium]|nr:ABC transporter ATP-binding protein [Bacteroidales bacterium]
MTSETIIEVENLVKKFGNFVANDNLTFSVRRGEILGFLGANGAGKTTAMKILCGISAPTSGKVHVAGFDAVRHPEKIKQNIGYMSQKFSLYDDLTIRENFRLFGGIYGLRRKEIRSRTEELLNRLDLYEYRNRILHSLPLGWKQKLAFSVAIMHHPKVVFLDEPTSGVDPVTRRQFWELIYEAAEEGKTIFVTTHYMDEAEYCDTVSMMVAGRIEAFGEPHELKKKFEVNSVNELFIKLARNEKAIS